MDTVIRNVGEIDAHDRRSLEHVLGLSLREDQQLVINIVNLEVPARDAFVLAADISNGKPNLPDWCNVYEGLSDDEIAGIEQTILQRADLSRPCE